MRYAEYLRLVRPLVAAVALAAVTVRAEEGFEPLFDGTSLAGWKVNENPGSWRVENGAIVCRGPRSHLFYVGPDAAAPADFTDFHLKIDVMTKPNANAGVFFHTAFQPTSDSCRLCR
jgi:hypothetical protein